VEFKGLNHVAFATGDMDVTVRYWRDLLGMKLVAGHGHLGHRQYFFQLSEYSLVAFFEWPYVDRVPYKRHGEPVKGPFIFDHISLGVGSDEELWQIAERLISANFPCSDMVDHGFIHSIYTYDPNGIPLEFSAYVKGMDLPEHPVIADEDRPEAGEEGPEPHPAFWPPINVTFAEDEKHIVEGEGSDVFIFPR